MIFEVFLLFYKAVVIFGNYFNLFYSLMFTYAVSKLFK